MGGAQITMLVLYGLTMIITIYQHGETKRETHNIWTTAIALAINYLILYWGGFWS